MKYDKYAIEIRKRNEEVLKLTVKERILALRLLEKQKKHPEILKQVGIKVTMVKKAKKE